MTAALSFVLPGIAGSSEAAKRGTKKGLKELLPVPGTPDGLTGGPAQTPPSKTDSAVQESVGDTLADIRKRRGRVSTILTGAGGLGGGGANIARTQLLGG